MHTPLYMYFSEFISIHRLPISQFTTALPLPHTIMRFLFLLLICFFIFTSKWLSEWAYDGNKKELSIFLYMHFCMLHQPQQHLHPLKRGKLILQFHNYIFILAISLLNSFVTFYFPFYYPSACEDTSIGLCVWWRYVDVFFYEFFFSSASAKPTAQPVSSLYLYAKRILYLGNIDVRFFQMENMESYAW